MVAESRKQEEIASVDIGKNPLDTFGVAIFLVIIVEILLLVGLNLYQKSRVERFTAELTKSRQLLASSDYSELNTQLQEALSGRQMLEQVLASKVQWSRFYTMLNEVTPKNVKVTTLQLGEAGVFRAEGQTQSLASLAQLLLSWQKGSVSTQTPFDSVVLSSNGYITDGGNRVVSFVITGTVNSAGLQQ